MTTPYRVASDAEAFAAQFERVLTKDKRTVPFIWNRAQRDLHSKRTGRDLVLKARQLGVSTYIQGELFRRLVTSTRTAITLAHLDSATATFRLMADRFWEGCEYKGYRPVRGTDNETMVSYPDFDSTATIVTAGSADVGRSASFSDFHGSEVAFWRDPEKIISGALQGGNPDAILESTPNGAQGYFYDLCMEALRGTGAWTLHFYPWWWDRAYADPLVDRTEIAPTREEADLMARHGLSLEQIKWRRRKQKELRGFFIQEYPEDPVTCFITSGNSYFGDLTAVFTAPMAPQYDPTHEYYAGLDFGQTTDFTAMPVIDKTARQQVDMLHINKMAWSEIRRRIAQKYREWHCQSAIAEWNSIGGPNVEDLNEMGVTLIPFKTTNQSKAEACADLYEAIHPVDGARALRLQDHPVLRHEMSTFVSSQTATGLWRLAAEGEGHDDTVIGLALAWLACKRGISDKDMHDYGEDKVTESAIDEGMVAYHADTYGMTLDEARKHLRELAGLEKQ